MRRADKIIQENSREERERERARYHFEISKILACRVEKKKVEDFFYRGDKRLPRQAANPSPSDFVCTHERHTHTYTRIIIARFIEARSRENLCTGSASFTLT